MTDIIQIVLLIMIAWFIIVGKSTNINDVFNRRRKLVLDSCSLIDGRIVEIVNSRFVDGQLVIPQFILNELQMLADGNDSHKRERARFGLDIAHQLQDTSPIPVIIDRSVFADISATDDKLVALSKKLSAQLYTTDYNLAKVAAIEGVQVLNVNELAQNLRPVALPGESLAIKIVQKGSNPGQGVGYLDDGTMIVVENATKYVGRVVPIVVTRMHQTVAGKMVFGQVHLRDDQRPAKPQQHSNNTSNSARTAVTEAARQSTASRRQPGASNGTAAKIQSRLSQKLRRGQ